MQRACRVCARTGDTGSVRPALWTPRPCGVVSATPSKRSDFTVEMAGQKIPRQRGGRLRPDGRDGWGQGIRRSRVRLGPCLLCGPEGPLRCIAGALGSDRSRLRCAFRKHLYMDVSAYGSDWKQPNNEDGVKKGTKRSLKTCEEKQCQYSTGRPSLRPLRTYPPDSTSIPF